MKNIYLKFEANSKTLSGENFGYNTYLKVKSEIDIRDVTKIIIPQNVEMIDADFVSGFCREIGRNIQKHQIIFAGGKDHLATEAFMLI